MLQLSAQLPALPASLAAGVGGAVLVLAGWRRSAASRLVRALLVVAAATAGFGYAAWRAELRLSDGLAAELEGVDVTVVGIVAELPRRFERGERFVFRVEAVETIAAAATSAPGIPGTIMLSWYRGQHEDEWFAGGSVLPGERWRFTVRLKKPHGHVNPGGFDYEAWLLERGVRATGYVRQTPVPLRLSADVGGLRTGVERIRALLRDRMLAALADRPHAGVLVALAMGDQASIDSDGWRVFAATGTTHLMSISGLHVTMFAALFGGCVGALWRRSPWLTLRLPVRRVAIAAGGFAALAYSLLAGFGVPAQRTLYMLAVAALALWAARGVRPRHTLALALVVVLVVDPWAVLAAGFWLSFGAVAALMLAGTGLGGERGWRARLRAWGWAQWAVTVGSVPLLVWLFQQFSLVSPLANAVAIPLVGLVVTPLAVSGAVAVALVPGVWLLQLAHLLLVPLMDGLVWLAALPVALWRQPEPPLWAVAVGLAGVGVLLLPRGIPGRWAGLALLAPALFPAVARPPPGEAWVDFLDVGHGLASIVRTAGHVLVFDTGPRYGPSSDAGERILVPVLRAAGVTAVDALVVSHLDSDHSGGAAALVEALPVRRSLSSLPAEFELRTRLPAHEPCAAGQRWEWDGVAFEMLHPASGASELSPPNSNRVSCVLRVEAGRRSVLLTADIEAPNEAVLAGAARVRADVLQAPHHGSRSSSTPAFVAAVAPADIVATVGYRNRFGHPHPEVLGRYAAAGARLWRTDRDGAVRVRLGETVTISGRRAERPRYWHGR